MTRPSVVPLLVAAGLAAAVAWQWHVGGSAVPEPPARRAPPAMRAWSSPDGTVTVRLPARWIVEPQPPEDGCVMSLWAHPPGARARAAFHVHVLTRVANARGRLYVERPAALAAYGAATAEMHVEGDVPWFAVVDTRRAEETRRRGYACRMLRGRAFLARFSTTPELAGAMEPAFVDAVRTLRTTLPEWPEPLEGFREAELRGLPFHLAPGTEEPEALALADFLVRIEERFSARLGPVPRDPGAPLRISFHPTPGHAARSLPGANAWGFLGWIDHRWLVATPLRGASPAALGELSGDWERMLWKVSFDSIPWWLDESVQEIARWRILAAAPLPAVPESRVPEAPRELLPFADVARMNYGELQDAGHVNALAYLVLFLAGPPQYTDAWEAFEAEMRRTGDPDAAQAHLLALDPERLREDAARFLRSGLRIVPGR